MMKLTGGVAPYMMGLVVGIAVVSTLSANQARLINETNAQKYINSKKEYADKLAESLANSIYDETTTSSSTFTTADAQKYVYTNIFDNSSTDAQVAVSADSVGSKKISISIDSNEYDKNKLASAAGVGVSLSDNKTAKYVSEENVRAKQVDQSYQKMKEQAYNVYNDLISAGSETFLCNPVFNLKDAWGRDFNYEYIDPNTVNLSFTLPWNTSKKNTIPLRLPDVSSKEFEIKDIYGYAAVYAVTTSGDLFVRGYNEYGQLGIGNTENRIREWTKTSLSNIDHVVYNHDSLYQISGTAGTAYAITKGGDVWIAGRYGYLGGIGSGNNIQNWTKTSLSDIKEVYTKNNFAYALTNTGDVYVTGSNSYGQIGQGSTSGIDTWTKLNMGTAKVADIALGASHSSYGHALLLTTTGDVYGTGYCSGSRCFGLGTGSSNTRLTTPRKTGLSNIRKVVSKHSSSYAINTSDELYVAGENEGGQLGMGSGWSVDYWTKVPTFTSVRDVAVFNGAAFAILNNGKVYITGNNSKGVLGHNYNEVETWEDSSRTGIMSVQFHEFSDWNLNSSGDVYNYAYFLDSTGYVYRNGGYRSSGADRWRRSGDNGYTKLFSLESKTYAMKADGDISVIGIGKDPELGFGVSSDPFKDLFVTSFKTVYGSGSNYVSILGGEGYNGESFYLKDKDGKLFTVRNTPEFVEFRGYGCPDGYTDNGDGTCSYSVSLPATETCPAGYTNNGSNCTRTTVRNPIGFGCVSGSEYNGGCYIQTGFASCPSGWQLKQGDSTLCYELATVHEQPCSPGFSITPGGRCAKYMDRPCPSGDYEMQPDRTCKRKTGDPTHICDTGFYLSGSKCYRTQTTSITYTCSSGTLNGTNCEDSNTVPKPGAC